MFKKGINSFIYQNIPNI